MKFKTTLLFFMAWLILATPLAAQEPSPSFLLEAGGRLQSPAAFRTCLDALPETPDAPSGQGLAEINASASEQFSQVEFRQMLRRLPPWLMVVDLRPQPHGFINGLAVSWEASPPGDAQADSRAWLEWEESERLQAAQEMGGVVMIAASPSAGAAPPPLSVKVQSAQSEAQLLALSGLGYYRLPLPSPIPSDQQVERFLLFRQSLPPGSWVHFHGGPNDDRPALMMLLTDILANARSLSLEDLASRQALLEGGLSLLPHGWQPGQSAPEGGLAQFITRFYEFARRIEPGSPVSWLNWLREQEQVSGPDSTSLSEKAERPE